MRLLSGTFGWHQLLKKFLGRLGGELTRGREVWFGIGNETIMCMSTLGREDRGNVRGQEVQPGQEENHYSE